MNRRNASIRHLMAGIFLLGVALAFLRFAVTHWGAWGVEIFALGALLATNVLAWFQKARWQIFWIGFGLSAWAYIAVALGSSAESFLPTTGLLAGLSDRFYPEPPDWHDPGWEERFSQWPALRGEFRAAGHSLIGLALGILGGVGAAVLSRRGRGQAAIPFPPDGSLLGSGWSERKKAD